jgi:aminopeptidase N
MFEQWIGPEKFRQGVLEHIKANAWGNANAAEFFAALANTRPRGRRPRWRRSSRSRAFR